MMMNPGAVVCAQALIWKAPLLITISPMLGLILNVDVWNQSDIHWWYIHYYKLLIFISGQ